MIALSQNESPDLVVLRGHWGAKMAFAATVLAAFLVCVSSTAGHLALGAAALGLAFVARRYPRLFVEQLLRPQRGFLIALGFVFFAIVLSLMASPVQWFDLEFVRRGRAWLGVFPLLLALSLSGRRLARMALWALLLGGVLAALLGLVQVFAEVHLWQELRVLLGMDSQHWQVPRPGSTQGVSAIGFYKNRTRFAHTLLLPLAFASAALISSRSYKKRFVAMVFVVPLGVALFVSYTRAATAAWVVSVVFLLVAYFLRGAKKGRIVVAVLVVTVLSLGALSSSSVRQRMASSVNVAVNRDRVFLWERATALMSDFGSTGIGFANYRFAHVSHHDSKTSAASMRSQGHNLLLSLWVELGGFGVWAFIFVLMAMWRSWRKARVGTASPGDIELADGAMAATLAFLFTSIFHDPLYVATEATAFIWLPAILGALAFWTGSSADRQQDKCEALGKWFFALLFLGALGLALMGQLLLVVVAVVVWGLLWWHPAFHFPWCLGVAVLSVGLTLLVWLLPVYAVLVALAILSAFVLFQQRRRLLLYLSVPLLLASSLSLLAYTGDLAFSASLLARLALSWALIVLLMSHALSADFSTLQQPRPQVRWAHSKSLALVLGLVIVAALTRLTPLIQTVPSGAGWFHDRPDLLQMLLRGKRESINEHIHSSLCASLREKKVAAAVAALRDGVILNPASFMTVAARLWRADLVSNYDRRQSYEIIVRVLNSSSDTAVLDGMAGRSASFIDMVSETSGKLGKVSLSRDLLQEDFGEKQLSAYSCP